jgi:predicted negative regulator of RcsB-dependent stress response|tara:strand:+ start:866 stop:1510 length:645 start_codon:yes stop_codon:yes gene_type:complete
MDEDIEIINTNTRIEIIKNFILKNIKKIIYLISFILIFIILILVYKEYEKRKITKIADRYILTTVNYDEKNKEYFIKELKEIIKLNNKTYTPLSLFFLIDNKLIKSTNEINLLIDDVIKNSNLDKEIKNLLVFKKALINSDSNSENELLKTLNPIINSDSIWKYQSLLLLGDYFFSKGENEKAKDFYNKILNDQNANQTILFQTKLKLRRNLSE